MQNLNKKTTTTTAPDTGSQLLKQTRHIVTWSPEEDDILREQIRINGTDNWAIIASKFKDKSTRQCRRRWYTYLNSDFKKGGWSPEEDMLLCEAQKIFGNRWTEIAKVVSGRTDNAVKNRFSTLCKKRAKAEALAKENDISYINLSNKRVIFHNVPNEDGLSENGVPLKKIRQNHIPNVADNCNRGGKLEGECGKTNPQLRPPLAVLVENCGLRVLPTQNHANNTKEVAKDEAANNKITEGMYLKKDDPKIIALTQQAQLLSSLALKVNTESTDESLESAWKTLQDFLNRSKKGDVIRLRISDTDFELEHSKELTEDLNSSKEGSQLSWRLSDLFVETPDSSGYSIGTTLLTHGVGDETAFNEADLGAAIHQDVVDLQPDHIGHSNGQAVENDILSCATPKEIREILTSDGLPPSDDPKTDNNGVCVVSTTEFSSPCQLTPLFRSLASGIPSPQFSESERHFLLKTLGGESPFPNPSAKDLQSPLCKRALLQSL